MYRSVVAFSVANYELNTAIDTINSKLATYSFSISEVTCDDGVSYLCFYNKVLFCLVVITPSLLMLSQVVLV